MPIVELDIAGTPTRVEVSDGYTPEDLDHIATALTPTIKPAEARARSSSYLYNKANQFVGALQGVGQDVQNLVGGQPYGAGFPGQRSGWDTASDVATAAAPVVAPRLTALGLAAGTLATGAGYDEPTADLINAGTQLLTGGVQAVKDVVGAVRGVGAAREAAKVAAEANVTTARGGVQAAKDAALAARTAVPEGQQLGEAVPGMRQATAAARAKLFDPIIGRLTALGRTVKAGTPEGERLAQALSDAQEEWGPVAGAGEKSVIRDVLGKLRPATPSPVETGVLDESGQMLMRTPQAPPGEVTAQELDDALKTLNKSGKGFAARRALVQATQELAGGTDVEGALSGAGREYFATIKPGQYFARQIATAGTPGQATSRAIRLWNQMSPETQALVDPNGQIGAMVGKAQQVMRKVGTATESLRTASTAAKTAGQAASVSGRAAAGLGVGSVIAIPRAVERFQRGDIRGGIEQLLIGSGIGAAVAVGGKTALRGATGPLARTAVGAGSVLSGLAGPSDTGYTPESTDSGSDTPVPTTPPAAPAVAGGGAAPIKPLAGPYGREIAAVASLVKIPPELLHSVMVQESGGNPNALSHPAPDQAQTPAHGLMQITPGTFASVAPQVAVLLGRKPSLENPLDNIVAAGVLWRHYLDLSKGDVTIAAKMYHGGEGTQAWGPRTEQYGRDITERYAASGGG